MIMRKMVCQVLLFLLWLISYASHAQSFEIVIETRILDFDPQAGVKSRQTLEIDFSNSTVTSSYETGTTDFFGIQLDSVRDNFVVEDSSFTDDRVSFVVKGSTASGAMLTPDIDYSFSISGKLKSDGKVTVLDVSVNGCHDGYPAYSVTVNGGTIYSYEHKSIDLLSLFGSCDVVL